MPRSTGRTNAHFEVTLETADEYFYVLQGITMRYKSRHPIQKMKSLILATVTLIQALMLTSCSEKKVIEDFSLEDCVISGLKGVTSDAAAVMVKSACREKENLHKEKIKNAKEEVINDTYGEKVAVESVSYDGWDKSESGGWFIKITNKLPKDAENIRYVRMRIGAGATGYCTAHKDFAFKVHVPPGESAYFLIDEFINDANALCVKFYDVRVKKQSFHDYIKTLTQSYIPAERLEVDPYGAYLDSSIPAAEAASEATLSP